LSLLRWRASVILALTTRQQRAALALRRSETLAQINLIQSVLSHRGLI